MRQPQGPAAGEAGILRVEVDRHEEELSQMDVINVQVLTFDKERLDNAVAEEAGLVLLRGVRR